MNRGASTDAKSRIVDYIHHVWNDGDVDACDRYLAESYTIHHDPGDAWNGSVLTREQMKERVRQSRAPFPDQQFLIREMFEEDNAVIASWTWKGTFLADLAGFTAHGREVTMSGITIYYLSGDQITGHWQEKDQLGVFQQLR